MTVDKRISYEMQGGKKPARNYLGKQKTVSNVPIKWKSGPDAPETELAYITKAEKDLLLKKNLHGSLKNGPNTGPDDIMSLDSQGDYTRDRSPGAYGGGSRQSRDRNEQHMREILTGQKNIGQTTKTGPRTRQYSNLPEYMKVKQPDGTYKNKYIGSAYKSYGQPSFWGNLFSRGARGYRGIKGLSAFGTPTFEATQGPDGLGYYTDDTDFGETRGAMPFGIMGLIANAINKFKKPKDMTEFNKLGLFGEVPEDFNRNRNISTDMGDSVWSDGTFTWGGKQPPASKQYYGLGPVPPSDPFKYSIGPQAVNVPDSPEWTSWEVPSGMMNDAYQANLEFFDNLNKGIVENNNTYQLGDNILDSLVNSSQVGSQNVNRLEGSVLDAQPKKGIMERISDFFFTPAGAAEMTKEDFEKFGAEKGFFGANDKLESMQEYYDAAKSLTAPGAKFAGANDPRAVRDFITKQSAIPFGGGSYSIDMENIPGGFLETTEDFTTQKDPYSYFANGGLASLFTRRG